MLVCYTSSMKNITVKNFTPYVLLSGIFINAFGALEFGYSADSQLPVFLFSHGLADTHKQAYTYKKSEKPDKYYLIDGRLFTFDYPDATEKFWRVNITQTSLAQRDEINTLQKAFHDTFKLLKKEGYESPSCVLVGLSRGASTIINFMGLYNPPEVRALVLESPFDSIQTIITHKIKHAHLQWVPGINAISNALVSALFFNYKRNGIQPKDTAPALDKDLPIFISCSLQDSLIPAVSTIKLYNILRASGHEHVYLFIAKSGEHSKILSSSEGKNYQNAVHAFYRKYKLPHDESFALQGEQILATCQPSSEELNHYFEPHSPGKPFRAGAPHPATSL